MSAEWKAGDVAMVTFDNATGDESARGIRRIEHKIAMVAAYSDDLWFIFGATARIRVAYAMEARHFVVIDPEDREQVARLASAFCGERWSHAMDGDECDPLTRAAMQVALREYANPVAPEPLGVGAVVEDGAGNLWTRIGGSVPDREPRMWRHRGHTARSWDELRRSVVRVLSEGIS